MSKLFKIFTYNLKMTLRQREALFWLFLFPVLLIVILGFVFGSVQVQLRVGVVDLDGSPVSRAIVEALQGIDAIVLETGSEEEERVALKDGDRNGILIIPEGFGREVMSGEAGEVTMIINRSDINTAEITSSTLRGIVEKIGQKMSGAPEVIRVSEEEAEDVKDFEYIDFMVPGILAITIMFGGLAGYSLEIATYREKGILRRIKVSPLSLSTFLVGGIASVLLFTLAQTVLLLAIGVLAFGLRLSGNYLYLAVMVLIGALSFLAVGFLIASITRNSRSAGLASQAVGLPMMFLSGIFFSVEWAPAALGVIARSLPLYYLGDGLRRIMIDSASLLDVWLDIAVLVGMGAVAFIASIRFFRWE